MIYWTYNWRKLGGSQRMITLSKEEEFYQQEYCGCVYSLEIQIDGDLRMIGQELNLGYNIIKVNFK